MRTENLTAILAANLEPDAKQTMWRHVFGITAGALAALILSGGILRVGETMERIHHDEHDTSRSPVAAQDFCLSQFGDGKLRCKPVNG